ncbi:MAG TPA: DNA polymerase domain-containing protein [Candidatus Bathyarchaeia archaeon]|nr:DNA polymerase domain-containing protein [Candidatus Bathyarchaeia archaeon]
MYKYAHPTDAEKSRVLEVTLKDCRRTPAFTRSILKQGDYLRYAVHNCDLQGDRMYLFNHDIFPLAHVEVYDCNGCLRYRFLDDSVESVDYTVPPLRVMRLSVEIAKKGRISSFDDPIGKITVAQAEQQIVIDSGGEGEKLLQLVRVVKEFDPDIVVTSGGDSFLFPYLTQRATLSNVLDRFALGRDSVPFESKLGGGKTFFSYGRTFYRASTVRLFGRVHVDEGNTFVMSECGFAGLFEIARMCRMPLHTASRASIGSSMSSLQFYQAMKDDVLIPRNKSLPEAFKSAYELLVGDRGGFVYEPRVGIHEGIGEVDFSSMYPNLMAKKNISAETVLCGCCPDSPRRIPELDYHICMRRNGIVPKTLQFVISKRQLYMRLRENTQDPALKAVFDARQASLKWILVTCFGYLGYKNAKFGTVDGHIGVCAFGRAAFLKAARMAEARGFTVVHGIVDSLWLKSEGATLRDYADLCGEISSEVGVPLNFEGRYKWIVFLPSKVHPRISVLNRYYGVMENGKLKVRGLEVRRRDTPKFVYDAQIEMIGVLAKAGCAREFFERVPEALGVVRAYRQRLLDGEVPVWDLVVSKHLSKQPERYKQRVSQVIAAEQLMREGAEVHAGGNVRFLFTDSESKRYDRRVRAEELLEEGVTADMKKYLLPLYASAASLLGFAGYTVESVYEAVKGYNHKSLIEF